MALFIAPTRTWSYGAAGRIRTDTVSLPRDFKSLVAPYYTTAPQLNLVESIYIAYFHQIRIYVWSSPDSTSNGSYNKNQ